MDTTPNVDGHRLVAAGRENGRTTEGRHVASLRLADLLASVSLLSDLGFALPPEESMRSTIIATQLARRLGLTDPEVSDVLYTTLLQHVGCTGYAHETSAVYGDELVVNAAAARVGEGIGDVIDTVIRATARGRRPADWARVVLYTLLSGGRFARGFATARCEVGRETARRLGLPETVRRGLHEVAEGWNGKGGVRGLRGDDISLPARIAMVAATASRFDEIGGADAVRAVLRQRSGGLLDPALVDAFLRHATEIVEVARAGDPRETLLAAEPGPVRTVPEEHLVDVAAAIGDVADLKSTFTLGHSSGVAALADRAAEGIGFDGTVRGQLMIASLLHDVGRVGVSNAIWDRPGPLTAAEWEQVRLHPYHSERIMSRSDALRPMAAIAGMHHERLDGSGYHRGARHPQLPVEARILAAADAFEAMTHERPHRPALESELAASELSTGATDGRLDPDAVDAVVRAAGVPRGARPRPVAPAGLSQRETDVLRLVARGLTNREIADRLVVSPRTAEHHVQHVYAKIGTSSRAAAALFAMEHGLLD
jgi:HD-GYP domain-containing protein (c-di-GMP phosphodiesterase class II)/DNA-binding CsgD family transcriptional regulator